MINIIIIIIDIDDRFLVSLNLVAKCKLRVDCLFRFEFDDYATANSVVLHAGNNFLLYLFR